MDEKCINCKYFHRLKYGFEVGIGFKESSCCIAFTRLCDPRDNIDDYDSFVIEVTENDICEMFTKRKDD